MKGNVKVLAELNQLLAEELTAVNQYMVHSEMCANWGYQGLHKLVQGRAIDEMKHAEKLIERILFLEGLPVVSKLNKVQIGADIPKQLANDVKAEYDAVKHYNAVIKLCASVGDNATKEVLDEILDDEDRHVDALEEKQDQVKQMSLQIFLTTQVAE